MVGEGDSRSLQRVSYLREAEYCEAYFARGSQRNPVIVQSSKIMEIFSDKRAQFIR